MNDDINSIFIFHYAFKRLVLWQRGLEKEAVITFITVLQQSIYRLIHIHYITNNINDNVWLLLHSKAHYNSKTIWLFWLMIFLCHLLLRSSFFHLKNLQFIVVVVIIVWYGKMFWFYCICPFLFVLKILWIWIYFCSRKIKIYGKINVSSVQDNCWKIWNDGLLLNYILLLFLDKCDTVQMTDYCKS